MENIYTFISALLCFKLAVHGTTTPDQILQSTPERLNFVLVGRNIKLRWSFKFHKAAAGNLLQIRLFTYSLSSKAKTTIASKDIESGVLQYNPFRNGNKRRFVCEIFFGKNGIGNASILIQNAQFSNTNDYGIIFGTNGTHLPVENAVSVKVVDLVRGDKSKDSKIIRSWSGQKLRLKCDVIHHRNTKPFFKWYRKPFTENANQNLFAPNNTKILIIEKVNTTDFGEYTCEAKTRMVKVKQKFKVDKLGYAGSPRNFEYTYYPNSKSYALYWEQPITKDGHWVTKYILEEWKANKRLWVKRHNITTLHVTIKNIETTTKYRVCAANEIGYKETSCSKPIQLATTKRVTSGNGGKSSQFWPSLYLIVTMAIMSSALSFDISEWEREN